MTRTVVQRAAQDGACSESAFVRPLVRLAAWGRSSHMARNSALLLASTVVNGALGFLYWSLAGNSLAVGTVGVASALLQAITLASLIATLGLGQTLIQRLPRSDDTTWSLSVNSVVFGGAVSGAVLGGLAVLVLPAVSDQFAAVANPGFACLVVAGTASLTVANLLDYIFIGQRAAQYILVRASAFGLLKLALLAMLMVAHVGAAAVVGSWVVGAALVSLGTCRWLIPRLGRPHRWTPRGVAGDLRELAPRLWRNHVISLAATILPTMMPTLVVVRAGADANAHFYIAWLAASLTLAVSQAVAGSLLAEGSYEPGRLSQQVRTCAAIITGLLAGPTLVLCLFGATLLRFFGPSYSQSYPVLLIFMAALVPDAITNVYITVCRIHGDLHVAALVNVAVTFGALASAWMLLPAFGATGAALGWLTGQFAGCAVVAGHMTRRRRSRQWTFPPARLRAWQ